MLTAAPGRTGGFSIIELSVALTIAGILLVLGAPAFTQYLQNARLGALAQGIYGGLQTARAEAVKLNRNVEFVLTNTNLAGANADTISPDARGVNWVVRQRVSASDAYALVEQKAAAGNDAGSISVSASAPILTFSSLGGITTGTAATIELTNPSLGTCSPAGPVACWNVLVGAGGHVRLCNPSSMAGDSRACY